MYKSLMVSMLMIGLLLAGCADKENESKNENMTDHRMNEPSILENDWELQQGDLGLDMKSPRNRMQANYWGQTLVKTSPNPTIKPVSGNFANNVIQFGKLFLGTPYEYGSNRADPSTFDCSDFTRWAFLGALGMDIPKDSRSQAQYVSTFSTRSFRDLRMAQPGDLLFFMEYRGFLRENYAGINPAEQRIAHVGIYLGNGMMLHTASKATGGVRIDYIFNKHLEWRFVRGGSVLY